MLQVSDLRFETRVAIIRVWISGLEKYGIYAGDEVELLPISKLDPTRHTAIEILNPTVIRNLKRQGAIDEHIDEEEAGVLIGYPCPYDHFRIILVRMRAPRVVLKPSDIRILGELPIYSSTWATQRA
jgi:hypothetical protein